MPIPERPWTTITIGSTLYDARAPKYQVWWDVLKLLEDNEMQSEAARKLREEADQLTIEEQVELAKHADLSTGFGKMEAAVIYGQLDATGRLTGGFLRRCLKPEDWDKLMAELDDDQSDLDLPDLYTAAMSLRETFDGWFQQRSATMGMPTPEPKTVARKKAPARKR